MSFSQQGFAAVAETMVADLFIAGERQSAKVSCSQVCATIQSKSKLKRGVLCLSFT